MVGNIQHVFNELSPPWTSSRLYFRQFSGTIGYWYGGEVNGTTLQVFHRKLYGADHVWIVPESVLEGLARWTNPQTSEPNSTCTWRNLRDAIEGVFGVKTHRGLVNITNTDYQTLQEVLTGSRYYRPYFDYLLYRLMN